MMTAYGILWFILLYPVVFALQTDVFIDPGFNVDEAPMEPVEVVETAQTSIERMDPVCSQFLDHCKLSQTDSVSHLLNQASGLDPNCVDTLTGNSCLFLATEFSNVNVIQLLLQDDRIQVDIKNRQGWTALMMATHLGTPNIATLLLQHHAIITESTNDGDCPLSRAVSLGDVGWVKLLLEYQPSLRHASNTGLVKACQQNDVVLVTLLLEKEANVNEQDYLGKTCLMRAVINKNSQLVLLMQQYHADPSLTNNLDQSALSLAALYGWTWSIPRLVKMGANINASHQDWTPLMYACQTGNVDMIDMLLYYRADMDWASSEGTTALMIAVKLGWERATSLLLAREANVHARNSQGQTALMIAIEYNQMHIYKILLEFGARVVDVDDDGHTLLMLLIQYKHHSLQLVQHVVNQGVDVNAQTQHGDNSGWTALMLAVRQNDTSIVTWLLDQGAQLDITQQDGTTALLEACQLGSVDMIQLLLHHGASLDDINEKQQSCLTRAVSSGHIHLVEFLLQQGANVDQVAYYGMTPLMMACEMQSDDLVRLLIEKGANVNATNDHGWNSLMFACVTPHLPTVKLLLEKGINIDQCDSESGKTALMRAMGESDIVSVLLQHGANVSAVAFDGTTVLMEAASAGSVGVLEYLLYELTLDNVNAETEYGETALMFAASMGHIEAAAVLLSHGAKLDIVSNEGTTALDMAAMEGYTDIALMLNTVLQRQRAHSSHESSRHVARPTRRRRPLRWLRRNPFSRE